MRTTQSDLPEPAKSSKSGTPLKARNLTSSAGPPTTTALSPEPDTHSLETQKSAREVTGLWPKGKDSINDGWFQRNKTWLLAKLKGFLEDDYGSRVVNVPWNKGVKFGKRVHLSQAFALQLVAEKTSVPVTRLLHAFKKGINTYIVIERFKGTDMNTLWEEMSTADKDCVIAEPKSFFEQLREIPNPRPGTI